ncbi:MAG: MtaA/CmuA family methyltransferase [Deltaproteobacteria bacterium]|nr:MtaA/CmuA family methyltransferase [Deltaproteobacteria bacterium]
MPSRVFDILRANRRRKPVCSCPVVTCTLEQMERVQASYPAAHKEAGAMAKLAEAAYKIVGFEGFRAPFDLCVEAEAFGCRIKPADGESPPSVFGPAFERWDEFFCPEDFFQKGRFPIVEGALRMLQSQYRDELPIYAGIAGPLTLASYLFGVEKVMKGMIKDPVAVGAILMKIAEFSGSYAQRLFAAGGNVLMLIDPTASGDLISAGIFQKFLLPAYQKIREIVPKPIVLHICGNTNRFLSFLPDSGFEGFSFEGPAVEVKSAKEAINQRMALVGNISTTDTLLFGDPAKVESEVKVALEQGIHIVAPSCGIPVRAPLENLRAMVEATEKYGMGE